MSYSEFLSSLVNGATLFFNSIITISNYLITNYFFITILGIVIILSVTRFLFSLIFNPFQNVIEDLDNPNVKTKIGIHKFIDEKIDDFHYKEKLRLKYPQLYRRGK